VLDAFGETSRDWRQVHEWQTGCPDDASEPTSLGGKGVLAETPVFAPDRPCEHVSMITDNARGDVGFARLSRVRHMSTTTHWWALDSSRTHATGTDQTIT